MNFTPSRRTFLKQTAWLPFLASAGFADAAFAPIKRVGGSHLKTSLNPYSFLELLNANLKDPTKGVNLFQVCDFCAEHNFDAVDPTGYFFPGYLPIETLASGRKNYDSFEEASKILVELQAAIATTENTTPSSTTK